MKFKRTLIKGRFKKRYKRFFADVEINISDEAINPKKEVVVAHCANTGSMTNCLVEDSVCWISQADNPKRKLRYTLEAVSSSHGGMAGVNTGLTNKLVLEALQNGVVSELAEYEKIETEVRFGQENSRLDFRLSDSVSSSPLCYLEVKNVTLGMPDGLGMFPDAVTSRGAKHLRELGHAVDVGYRAVLLFCVQHEGIDRVMPAKSIDPVYYQALVDSIHKGVEVIAYKASLSRSGFVVTEPIPFLLSAN